MFMADKKSEYLAFYLFLLAARPLMCQHLNVRKKCPFATVAYFCFLQSPLLQKLLSFFSRKISMYLVIKSLNT